MQRGKEENCNAVHQHVECIIFYKNDAKNEMSMYGESEKYLLFLIISCKLFQSIIFSIMSDLIFIFSSRVM